MGDAVNGWLKRTGGTAFSAYCIAAAFGTYFCMYAFRKPFTAGTYEAITWQGFQYKTILVTAQVAGYALSKFIGIQAVSEMPPRWRAISIVGLIAVAEAALLAFALTPVPYNWVFLFLNGLPLGCVFGLVLSFLEGRRFSEALSAGLCASFIVSSGVVKTIGKQLVQNYEVSEFWMPVLVGLMFVPPLLICVWMLQQIPPPNDHDVQLRSLRSPMTRSLRWSLFLRHRWGLTGLVAIYVLITVSRSLRDDFGVEIWADLGFDQSPGVFAISETLVMLGVVLVNGLAICIVSNRRAFLSSIALLVAGFSVVLVSVAAYQFGGIGPFAFMVLIGLGTYVPYVAFHTTIFERFIAVFREPGNIAYLMYLADAAGYFGYVLVVLVRNRLPGDLDHLGLFIGASIAMSIASIAIAAALWIDYQRRIPTDAPVWEPESPNPVLDQPEKPRATGAAGPWAAEHGAPER